MRRAIVLVDHGSRVDAANVLLDRILNVVVGKIIYISHAVQQSFMEQGYKDTSKAVVIYNGIEAAGYEAALHSQPDYQVVMTVAQTPASATQQLCPLLTFSTRRESEGCCVSVTVTAAS